MAAKRARMKENIGAADDPHAFSLISIAEQGLPTVFPDAVIDRGRCGERSRNGKGREDLTALPFITIDPADARDHDDAVFAEPDPNHEGGFIVWVAIADVAAYVTPEQRDGPRSTESAAIRFICRTALCLCCRNAYRMIYAHCAKMKHAPV